MTFADLALGASVFLDANTLLYHFTADAQFGAACTTWWCALNAKWWLSRYLDPPARQ